MQYHLYRLVIHDDAKNDLNQLRTDSPSAAALIVATLEEYQADQDLLENLLVHDYGKNRSEDIHVSRWFAYFNRGKDLWRLKIWELEDQGEMYRVVYAYMRGKRLFYVLAIAPRDFDYDPSHPITGRILVAYEAL